MTEARSRHPIPPVEGVLTASEHSSILSHASCP